MPAITWLPWSAEAFERATAEQRPVLLSITASWCHWCLEMDRTSYADPSVVELVNDRFVPVRVDADRRPDISERYSLGGLPTTAFLTAAGEIVGGGTYVPVERMAGELDRVANAFRSRRAEIASRAGFVAPQDHTGNPGVTDPEHLAATVFAAFDAESGGFGTEPKFPLIAPLHLAMELYRDTRDEAMSRMLETTLDAMGWGGLYDGVDGGFFRYAATRDWQLPHQEKLLDVNAAMLRLYLDAAELFGRPRYRERALDVLRYLQTSLADQAEGGWWGSQQADHLYYSAGTPEARRVRVPPPIDRVLYAGWNAAMVSSALHAAGILDDPSLGEFAVRSLERVLLACYRPGAGVAHYFDGEAQVRGLLDDQIAMVTAALDAYDATGNIVYEMMAEELAHYAVRTMWDPREGGFFDRAPGQGGDAMGLLARPMKPFAANCEAARALHRLAAASGEHEFDEKARGAIATVAPSAQAQGPLAAHYLLAIRDLRPR